MADNEPRDLYAVWLLFEATHPDEPAPSEMWEERIVVVRAADEADAERLARGLPESKRIEYRNEAGNRVVWVLTEVVDVVQLLDASVGDGAEVYYSLHDRESVDALRRSFKARG